MRLLPAPMGFWPKALLAIKPYTHKPALLAVTLSWQRLTLKLFLCDVSSDALTLLKNPPLYSREAVTKRPCKTHQAHRAEERQNSSVKTCRSVLAPCAVNWPDLLLRRRNAWAVLAFRAEEKPQHLCDASKHTLRHTGLYSCALSCLCQLQLT